MLGNVKAEILLILDGESDKDEIAERIGGLLAEKIRLVEAHFQKKMEKGFEEAYQIIQEVKRQTDYPTKAENPYRHPFSSRSWKETQE